MSNLRTLITDNPYQRLLSIAWGYAEGMRGKYILIYLMFTGVNLLISLQPVIFGLFINHLQKGEGNLLQGTWIYLALHMAIIFAFWSLQWPARLLERRMAFDISKRLLMEVYDKIIHLPLSWHREHHSGDTINRARKAYEALKNFFDNGFAYFQTIARMAIALIALLWFSPVFGMVAVVAAVIIFAVVLAFDKPMIEAITATNDKENELMAGFSDKLTNIITVTTLRLGKRTAADINGRIDKIWPPFLRGTRINEQKWFSISVLTGLMYIAMVGGYVYENYVPGEVFLVGGLVTLIGYVNQFANMLSSFTMQYGQIVRYRSDLAAIDPIEEAYAELSVPSAEGAVDRAWQKLRVEGLNFRYDENGAGVFDVSLNLDRGRRIAIIGPSGSGKTTTLYALRGLYPPEQMTLLFNEPASHPAAAPAQLFEQTTLIPQSPEIFEDTLRNNLTMGLDRSAEELTRAIRTAVLDDVVEQADEGLETFLSEGGANLSGGQRQRLSIARGLLAADTSTLLLLDEPTSSLDPKTEILAYERIFAAFPDKTVVSTLHRLHLLRFFDYIYYMENGRVAAEGTLEELLETSEGFRAMYAEQVSAGNETG
ncbi:ABC transporter ATP-binding protein [Neolewinella aurantiaca]|uniref:ABC transporter ATP-binding protein n=1 Tax=Neolewinella aurantiaca TaxID=2602767 RepID=A0A5C7FID2_9BACT|nr:ABC transporter ATP-binding protein [Neolewinella aurantiaca]TXF89589.1 ABC transporter ATP-binding protein [Neolewinella aurantiaca]